MWSNLKQGCYKSILNNDNDEVAREYIEGLCTPSDWQEMADLDRKEFYRQFANIGSKVLPFLSQSFARARIECSDPGHEAGIEEAQEIINKTRAELKEKEEAIEAKDDEIKRLKEAHVAEMRLVKAVHEKAVKIWYKQGIQEGKASFLRSAQGLRLVERIQTISQQAALRSKAAVDVIASAVFYYVSHNKASFEAWKASGKDAADFDLMQSTREAGDCPETSILPEEEQVASMGPEELLDHIIASDASFSKTLAGSSKTKISNPEAVINIEDENPEEENFYDVDATPAPMTEESVPKVNNHQEGTNIEKTDEGQVSIADADAEKIDKERIAEAEQQEETPELEKAGTIEETSTQTNVPSDEETPMAEETSQAAKDSSSSSPKNP